VYAAAVPAASPKCLPERDVPVIAVPEILVTVRTSTAEL